MIVENNSIDRLKSCRRQLAALTLPLSLARTDELRLVNSSGDRSLQVCDGHSGQETRTLSAQEFRVTRVAFSPVNHQIVKSAYSMPEIRASGARSVLFLCHHKHAVPICRRR